ncbi:MAG: hypothetical protein J3R72DRAFT_170131 [Linnemannia gamsii]|nr:MAG: hypothetical protein J3R72DRAFT_170131 [Linnemannia gamsii]
MTTIKRVLKGRRYPCCLRILVITRHELVRPFFLCQHLLLAAIIAIVACCFSFYAVDSSQSHGYPYSPEKMTLALEEKKKTAERVGDLRIGGLCWLFSHYYSSVCTISRVFVYFYPMSVLEPNMHSCEGGLAPQGLFCSVEWDDLLDEISFKEGDNRRQLTKFLFCLVLLVLRMAKKEVKCKGYNKSHQMAQSVSCTEPK